MRAPHRVPRASVPDPKTTANPRHSQPIQTCPRRAPIPTPSRGRFTTKTAVPATAWMTIVKAEEPGGAPKGFSPGPGTGYGLSTLITLATPNPVSRNPSPIPNNAGHALHRPVNQQDSVEYPGRRTDPAMAVGTNRPRRSARPDTPVAT